MNHMVLSGSLWMASVTSSGNEGPKQIALKEGWLFSQGGVEAKGKWFYLFF